MRSLERIYCKECGRLIYRKRFCDKCQKSIRPVSMRRVIKLQR